MKQKIDIEKVNWETRDRYTPCYWLKDCPFEGEIACDECGEDEVMPMHRIRAKESMIKRIEKYNKEIK